MKISIQAAMFLLLLILLLIQACEKAPHQISGSLRNVALREGDYLSTPYIDKLQETHSPLRAGSAYGAHLYVVRRDGRLWRIEPIWNFHEGGCLFILHPEGSVTVDDPGSAYISKISMSVPNESSFRIGFDDSGQTFKPTDYVFVQNADIYIAEAALAGRYKDGSGQSYEFRGDGSASFPGGAFKFQIGTDHAQTNFDYLVETDSLNVLPSTSMAFEWQTGGLQLFRTREVRTDSRR